MTYERIVGKDCRPTDATVASIIGDATLWRQLIDYLDSAYGIAPEWIDYGKHGWTLRYRKGGKTLCSLFPEQGAFTVLVVLGGKEAEQADVIKDKFSAGVRKLFEETEKLHDGCWLWIRVLKKKDMQSVQELLKLKRKPKK